MFFWSSSNLERVSFQWFGNLVTMKWWNDLWLNEGFATFMENIGASFVEPNWSMMDQFVVKKLQVAFSEDQSSYSHPISVDVKDPKDIDSMFDSISYEKVWINPSEKALKLGIWRVMQTIKIWQAHDNNSPKQHHNKCYLPCREHL